VTDPHGAHGKVDKQLQDQGWKWLASQVRNRFPQRVIYKTSCLRYDGAYWAHIDTIQAADQPARIEAKIEADGSCRVTIENADRFHLDLDAGLIGKAATISVRVNDSPPLMAATHQSANFAKVS